MDKLQIIKELKDIADYLDDLGFTKEASEVTATMIKVASTLKK